MTDHFEETKYQYALKFFNIVHCGICNIKYFSIYFSNFQFVYLNGHLTIHVTYASIYGIRYKVFAALVIHEVVSWVNTVKSDSGYQHFVAIYYLHLQDGSKQIWGRVIIFKRQGKYRFRRTDITCQSHGWSRAITKASSSNCLFSGPPTLSHYLQGLLC